MGGDIDLVTADPFHVIDCILEKEFSAIEEDVRRKDADPHGHAHP